MRWTSPTATSRPCVLLASREIARRMVQVHLDLRAQQERGMPPPQVHPEAEPRAQQGHLDTIVGRVCVTRRGWQYRGDPTVRPLDAALDLPREVYSAGVRRMVCDEMADRSVGSSCRALAHLGIRVPRRQAEQLAVRMTRDFDDFYREREYPANDTVFARMFLVLSPDAKGIRVLPRALREATRKAAANEAAGAVRGDPMAPRSERGHDRRMAVVTAAWDQGPVVRRAEDILEQLRPPSQRRAEKVSRPRPRTKLVAATIAKDQNVALRELFADAKRREPRARARVGGGARRRGDPE